MNEYLEIASSLYSNSLTLFVGTGFSKYITNGNAPSWVELLVSCTEVIDKDDNLKNQLFNTDVDGTVKEAKYELTVCAQILEGEYQRKRKNIKEQITKIIRKKINKRTIDDKKLTQLQSFFNTHPNINIITTNYDTLFSEYIFPLSSRIIIEGSTIPRINTGQNIYHIHGCISKPQSIVLTINDYYNFQNSTNYFSRKFFTLLQETTVVILGYSLGDFNLNSILNEVMNTKKESFRKADLFYVTRDSISDLIERFYNMTYGIKVIRARDIDRFFKNIESNFEKAKELMESVNDLQEVINGEFEYTDDFLKLEVALSSIMLQASSLGVERTDEKFLTLLFTLLKKKKEFTTEPGAWSQYEHLANWVIDIASLVNIKDTDYENDFCEIVLHSLRNCSKQQYLGYSWAAWYVWRNRWGEMKIENQHMILELIKNNHFSSYVEIDEIFA